jgi:hypothetical protein
MPGIRTAAEATGSTVAPEVTEPVSVVCWDRDEYLRVTGVIYRPIGCSGLGRGTEAFALMILLQDVAYTSA